MAQNLIINGQFEINQRGFVSGATLAAGAYGHDRWKAGANGCTYTYTQGTNGITLLTILEGSLLQVVEGANRCAGPVDGYGFAADLGWFGTATGRCYQDLSAPSGYASSSAAAETNPCMGALNVRFPTVTADVIYVEFTGGTLASCFLSDSSDHELSYGETLAACQRYYYQRDICGGTEYFSLIEPGNVDLISLSIPFPVTMRAVPTIAFTAASSRLANALMS